MHYHHDYRRFTIVHVPMLRKYQPDPSCVLDWVEIEIEDDISYEEQLVKNLETNKFCGGRTIFWSRYFGIIMESKKALASENPKSFQSINLFPSCSTYRISGAKFFKKGRL